MIEIKVSKLIPNLTFSEPLFDENGQRICPPNAPLLQSEIDFLKKVIFTNDFIM